MNIIDVMNDEEAFAPWFEGPSWDAWRIILRAAYCLPMTPQELITFGELVSRVALFEGAPVTVFDGQCGECAA